MDKATFLELMDQYIDGTMSSAEKYEFEQMLKRDPLLQEEFELHKSIRKGIKISARKDLLSELNEIKKEVNPSDNVFRRTFSSAFSFLVDRKSIMSAWNTGKYATPAPGRVPNWLLYEKLSSNNFITGTTPAANPSLPLIGEPALRKLPKIKPTPPALRLSCNEFVIWRPMSDIVSES